MMQNVMRHIRNYFETENFYLGEITIQDKAINPDIEILEGQYYRIIGSILNDGVYKKGEAVEFKNEKFYGKIVALIVPIEFEQLVNEINEYKPDNSGIVSESFGGYSYTKSSDSNVSWEKKFASRLNDYRKL